jgi:hypothetical protein
MEGSWKIDLKKWKKVKGK